MTHGMFKDLAYYIFDVLLFVLARTRCGWFHGADNFLYSNRCLGHTRLTLLVLGCLIYTLFLRFGFTFLSQIINTRGCSLAMVLTQY